MPRITDIKQQKRLRHRFSVYVDGKFKFSLTQNELVNEGLRIGQEVSTGELDQLGNQSQAGKIMDRVYNFLSYRARSEREVRDYLRRKDQASAADQIVAKLKQGGWLDDAQFAKDWVRDRADRSSSQKLRYELRQKGIASDMVDEVVGQVDDSQAALQLIQTKNLPQKYPDERKLIGYLAGKGFRYSDIKKALSLLETEA